MGHYSGTLDIVGTGRIEQKGTVISVIKIGDTAIKRVWASDYLSSFLNPGRELTLAVGTMLFGKWLLAVKDDDVVYKEGIIWFTFVHIGLFFLLTILSGLALVFIGGMFESLGSFLFTIWIPGLLLGFAYMFYTNFKLLRSL